MLPYETGRNEEMGRRVPRVLNVTYGFAIFARLWTPPPIAAPYFCNLDTFAVSSGILQLLFTALNDICDVIFPTNRFNQESSGLVE